jgi:hypothetical protein
VTGYHVTTPKKRQRYTISGCILPPVRFWLNLLTAQRWARRTCRTVILEIEVEAYYPLPDHKPACWSPEIVRGWKEISL